jgi:hypothetical protein
MPFWYQVPIPALDDPQPAKVRLAEWLVAIGGEVHRGTRIAVIEAPSGRYFVLANGEGILRERHFPAGAEIDLVTPIAVICRWRKHSLRQTVLPCRTPCGIQLKR